MIFAAKGHVGRLFWHGDKADEFAGLGVHDANAGTADATELEVTGRVGPEELAGLVVVLEGSHRRQGGCGDPAVEFFPHLARKVLRVRTRHQPPDFR